MNTIRPIASRSRRVPSALFLMLCALLVSCGSGSNRFKMTGKFKNMNQGEFYVYSLDGGLETIDTIRVERGRFVYETPCSEPSMFVLLFPNFSEQPIFAEPGGSVEVKGDVSSLRDLEVSGTDDNELLTAFRRKIAGKLPAEVPEIAETFVLEHLESRAGMHIVRRYFMQGESPDYKKAEKLLTAMSEKRHGNLALIQLLQRAKNLKNTLKGSAMPSITATDIDGKKISSTSLKKAPVAVITTCASWNNESMNLLRQLHKTEKKSRGKLKQFTILLDGNQGEIRRIVERDSITCPILFDDQFFNGKAMKQLGLSFIGDNILYQNGKVVASSLPQNDLIKEIENRLK